VLVELSQDSVDRQFINAGDQLIIGDSLDQVTDSITLVGHVKRPESIAWKPGMTFTDAVYDVNALLPMPDIDLALIERESPETREIQVLTLSPKSAFAARTRCYSRAGRLFEPKSARIASRRYPQSQTNSTMDRKRIGAAYR